MKDPNRIIPKDNTSDEWETPQKLFDELNQEFNFTLDPCAANDNHKCDKYFTKKENGLLKNWNGESVFINPPYGTQTQKWVRKAFFESRKGATCVLLIPARTDTSWWHDFCMQGEIRFIRGRIKFSGYKWNAPFASAIIIFKSKD